MKKPEIEVVRFGAEDVIATSGAPKLVTWSGVGGTMNDSILTVDGKSYSIGGDGEESFYNSTKALLDYYGWSDNPKSPAVINFSLDGGTTNYINLPNLLIEDGLNLDSYNGDYTFEKFDGTYYWFYHQ